MENKEYILCAAIHYVDEAKSLFLKMKSEYLDIIWKFLAMIES